MEGGACANAVRKGRRSAHHERAAHAVASRTQFSFFVDRSLVVEKRDKCLCIDCNRGRRQRIHHAHQCLARRRIIEIGMLRRGWRFLHTIERVDHQDRVSRLGQPRRHLFERRAKSENIGPDEHAGMLAAHRVHEIGVCRSVGGLYLNIRPSGFGGVGKPRQCRDQSCPNCHRPELPARQVARAPRECIHVVKFTHSATSNASMNERSPS